MTRPQDLWNALLFVFTLMSASVWADTPAVFDHITVRQGLSQNSVHDILQDRHGYLWVATQDGLNRFNGYQFEVYRHVPEDDADTGALRRGVSNSTIWKLYEDRDGVLWIGTAGGLNRFDRESEGFNHFRHYPDRAGSLSHATVRDMLEDQAGNFWIATARGGLNRMDRERGEFSALRHVPGSGEGISSDRLSALAETADGYIWIGTEDAGLSRFDPVAGTFLHFRHDAEDENSLSSDHVTALLIDRAGILWVATDDAGLNRLDPADNTIRRYQHDPSDPQSISSNELRSLYEDSRGRFWVGHYLGGGLDLFNRGTGHFTQYRSENGVEDSLNDDHILAILEDAGGVLWFGTHVGGLNKYDTRQARFRHYRHEWWNDNSLSDNTVRSFYRDDQTLYIGTEGGLNALDLDSGRFRHYQHDPDDSEGIPHNVVRYLDMDAQGRLWIATHGGLSRFDPQTGRFHNYHHDPEDPESLSSDTVWRVRIDSQGLVWAGARDALNVLDPGTGRFQRYVHDPDDSSSIAGDRIIALIEDRHGDIWFSTVTEGVNRFDRKNDRFINYTYEIDNPNSLSNPFVFSIAEDEEGVLWFGTRGGLNRFEPESGRFTHITETDGLANDVIYGILFADNGDLWTSSNRGISRFNRRTGTINNFDTNDGLQDDEFNNGAYHHAATGEMYFGGVNGFNVFTPGSIRQSDYEPPVVISRFSVLNENRAIGTPFQGGREVVLDHNENYLSFEFAALDFSAPERIRYAYQLRGFEDGWIEAGERRFASYTNLPPGRYQFRVRATNADGQWSPHMAVVPIHITPALWQTLWFQLTLFILAVALGAVLYRYKVLRVRIRNRELELVVAERTTALKQSNEQLLDEVEQRRIAEEEIRKVAYHDHLTGLPNRRLFLSLGAQAMADARRNDKGIAVMFLDLDTFKEINDQWGHDTGDRVLVEVTERIQSVIRGNDILSRIGGDEFTLILSNVDGPEAVETVARKLLEVMRDPVHLQDGEEAIVGISIGISIYPDDHDDLDLLVKYADRAMYRAKKRSGSQYEFHRNMA